MPGARQGHKAAEMRACQRAHRSRPARRGCLTLTLALRQALATSERQAERLAAGERRARSALATMRAAYADIHSIMAALPPPTPRSGPREGTPPAPWCGRGQFAAPAALAWVGGVSEARPRARCARRTAEGERAWACPPSVQASASGTGWRPCWIAHAHAVCASLPSGSARAPPRYCALEGRRLPLPQRSGSSSQLKRRRAVRRAHERPP